MARPEPTVRVAVVQAEPAFLDLEGCLRKAEAWLERCAQEGARIVAFPETWVPGYPIWANKVPANRNHRPALRAFARLWEHSVEVPGPACDALGEMAHRFGVYLVIGVNERDGAFSRGTLYNTVLLFGPDGRLLGRHRKLMPTFHERTIWGVGDASGLRAHPTPWGRLGALVCWEHWMPLARFALHADGEEVHCALWPSMYGPDSLDGEMVQVAVRHYAHEGRCFVLSACAVLGRDALPADFPLRDLAGSWPDPLLAGGSAIVAPDGRYLAGPAFEREALLVADLPLEELREYRQSLDPAGHYHRPDLFRVEVDRTPRPPVRWVEASPQTPPPEEPG